MYCILHLDRCKFENLRINRTQVELVSFNFFLTFFSENHANYINNKFIFRHVSGITTNIEDGAVCDIVTVSQTEQLQLRCLWQC